MWLGKTSSSPFKLVSGQTDFVEIFSGIQTLHSLAWSGSGAENTHNRTRSHFTAQWINLSSRKSSHLTTRWHNFISKHCFLKFSTCGKKKKGKMKHRTTHITHQKNLKTATHMPCIVTNCMHACMYVYMYVYIYIYVCMCVRVCLHECLHACVCVCVCAQHTWMCVSVFVWVSEWNTH